MGWHADFEDDYPEYNDDYDYSDDDLFDRADKGIWKSSIGEMKIVDMETSHILNCLKFIEGKGQIKNLYRPLFVKELRKRNVKIPEEPVKKEDDYMFLYSFEIEKIIATTLGVKEEDVQVDVEEDDVYGFSWVRGKIQGKYNFEDLEYIIRNLD